MAAAAQTKKKARARRRRPGRPPADEANHRERLLDAALACFTTDGVAATSQRSIAVKAGVNAGDGALLLRQQGQAARRVHRGAHHAGDRRRCASFLRAAGEDPHALVAAFVRGIHGVVERYPWSPALWVREVIGERGALREVLCSTSRASAAALLAQTLAGAAEGRRREPRTSTRGSSSSRCRSHAVPARRASRSGGDMFDARRRRRRRAADDTRWRCSIKGSEALMRVESSLAACALRRRARRTSAAAHKKEPTVGRHARVGPRRRDRGARRARAALGRRRGRPRRNRRGGARAGSAPAGRADRGRARRLDAGRREAAELTHGARIETIDTARANLASAHAVETDARGRLHARRRAARSATSSRAAAVDTGARDAQPAPSRRRKAQEAQLLELTHGTRPEQIEQAAAAVDGREGARSISSSSRARGSPCARRARVASTRCRSVPGDQPSVGAELVSMLVGDAPYARVFVPAPQRAATEARRRVRGEARGRGRTFTAVVRSIRSEPSFTPYYALAGDDASRLVYRAELVLRGDGAADLPAGLPCRRFKAP